MSAAESKEAISSTSSSQNFISSSQIFTSSSQSTCPYQNFIESVQYALSQLKMSHLKLKEEQGESSLSYFRGQRCFCFVADWFWKECLLSGPSFCIRLQTRPGWWPEEECCCGGISSHCPDGRPGQEFESPWYGGCDYLLWSTGG